MIILLKNRLFELFDKNNINIDIDLFSYGYDISKHYLIYLCFVVPLIIIMHSFLYFLFFIIIFTFLRRYLGGYHFNNNYLCTFFSILFTILILQLSISIKIIIPVSHLLLILYFFLIWIIGPVDHINKKINKKELHFYKIKTLKILIVDYILFILLSHGRLKIFANIIFFTLTFCTINLLIGKLIISTK